MSLKKRLKRKKEAEEAEGNLIFHFFKRMSELDVLFFALFYNQLINLPHEYIKF